MKLPILYSRTETGAIQTWQIEIEGNKYRSISGQQDGKLTTNEWTVVDGKNEGKKNATSGDQQALKEAKSKWKKKMDKGYCESIGDIDNIRFEEPMLAEKYKDYVKKKGEINIEVYFQPKIDGERLIISKDEDGYHSRNGKMFLAGKHIHRILQPLCEKYNVDFDGEAYNHEYKDNFNKIASLLAKGRNSTKGLSDEDTKDIESKVQFYVFDYRGDNKTFGARHINLKDMLKDVVRSKENPDSPVILVETRFGTVSEVEQAHSEWIRDGYEGTIIRFDTPYENKRTWNLLKKKDFIDEEFQLVDVLQGKGNRAGMAGKLWLKDKEGRKFKAGLRGNNAFRVNFLENKDKYIGLYPTIRYQELTPEGDKDEDGEIVSGGVPRFGVMIKLRDKDGDSVPLNILN